jgi:hypothetical protein
MTSKFIGTLPVPAAMPLASYCLAHAASHWDVTSRSSTGGTIVNRRSAVILVAYTLAAPSALPADETIGCNILDPEFHDTLHFMVYQFPFTNSQLVTTQYAKTQWIDSQGEPRSNFARNWLGQRRGHRKRRSFIRRKPGRTEVLKRVQQRVVRNLRRLLKVPE